MRRLLFLIVALLFAMALNASAEERKLTGDEIHKLLAGNSVHGMWGQSEYKSYFDPGGATIYHAKGRDPSSGYWRTTATQYCSTWNDHESCYDLFQDGDTDHLAGAGQRQPLPLDPRQGQRHGLLKR